MNVEIVNDGQNLALIPSEFDDETLAALTAIVTSALTKAGYTVENSGEIDFEPMYQEQSRLKAIAQRAYYESIGFKFG